MFRFLNKKIRDNRVSRGINQILKIIPSKSRLNSPGGQVAVILILIVALALIFYATTLNLSRVTQTKSVTMVAADAGASRLASQMASYSQSILMTTMGGRIKVCKSTSLLSAIIKLIIVIIVCIIAPPAAPAMIALAIVGIALSVASVVLEMTVVQPGITDMWNKMMSNALSFEDRFVEMGVQTGLMKAVTDSGMVDDVYDFDTDGEYTGIFGNSDDKISRFGVYYTQRLNAVTFPDKDDPNELVLDNGPVYEFVNELLDLTYYNYNPEFPWHRSQRAGELPVTDPLGGDSWGFYNPPVYCPVPEPLPADSSLVFSECNPCCLPERVLNPTYDADLPDHAINNPLCLEIRNPCCDGGGGVDECIGSELYDWCESSWTSHYGEGGDTEFPWVYYPSFEDNSEDSGVSFIEGLGRDDEIDYYMRCKREDRPEGTFCEDAEWDPNRVQQLMLSGDLVQYRITDVTGYYANSPYYHSYMNYPSDGIFRLFYELRDWSVELERLFANSPFDSFEGLPERLANKPENCFWADWTYLLEMEDYQIDCAEIIEEDLYFVMPWMLSPGQMSLTMDPRTEYLLCEKRPYVDTEDSDSHYPIENFGDFCGPTLVPDRISLPGSYQVGSGGGPDPDPSASPGGGGGGDLGSSCGFDTYDSIIVPKEDRPPEEVCAQETVSLGGVDNCDIVWREGADRYCNSEFSFGAGADPCGDTDDWPYFIKCDKFFMEDGSPCASAMQFEEWTGLPSAVVGAAQANCTCPDMIVGGDRSRVELWPEDIIDDIVYGLRDFIDWSEALMNNSMLFLYRDFFKWYDDAANWIEPNSYVTDGIRNSGDNPCFVCFNDQNQDEDFSGGDEVLWGRLREYQSKMEVVLDRLNRMYRGINYSGNSCDHVWCTPPGEIGNEWCIIPDQPPELGEREEYTFDYNGNDVRGDMEDTMECLEWNISHSRVGGCSGNDGKFSCCYSGCLEVQACTEDTCPDIVPLTIQKCEYMPRSLLPSMDPRPYLDPWGDLQTLVTCRDDSEINPLLAIPECAEDCEGIPDMGFGSYRTNEPNFITADQEAALNAEWVEPIFYFAPIETPDLLSFLSAVSDDWSYAVSQGWTSHAGIFAACLNSTTHDQYLLLCSSLPSSHGGMPSPRPSPEPEPSPPTYNYSSGGNPDPGSELIVVDPGTCGDGSFFSALDQAIWVADQSCADYGWNYLLDIQGTAGDRRVEDNLGWMDDVHQSWIEAINQVDKFSHRLGFLQDIVGDMQKIMSLFGDGSARINDFIENFAEPLTRHRIHLDGLHMAARMNPNLEKGLPYRAIYGWQDKPDVRKGELSGAWHVVKVDARTPGRCDSACNVGQDWSQDWPTVRTETHGMGTRRCYFMVNYTGTVKFRVQRYDQIKDEYEPGVPREPLTFENGTSIWDFRQYHPGSRYAGVDVDLGNICEPAVAPNPPAAHYDVGGLPFYTEVGASGPRLYWGGYILNNQGEHPGCWNQSMQLLSQGVVSETCAQYYYAPYDGDKGGFTHRFVPCRVSGESW